MFCQSSGCSSAQACNVEGAARWSLSQIAQKRRHNERAWVSGHHLSTGLRLRRYSRYAWKHALQEALVALDELTSLNERPCELGVSFTSCDLQ